MILLAMTMPISTSQYTVLATQDKYACTAEVRMHGNGDLVPQRNGMTGRDSLCRTLSVAMFAAEKH
jgi:hypothetical protein